MKVAVRCCYAARMRDFLTVVLALLIGASAWPAERSRAVRAEFQRQNPCPANGQRRGPCPGYVVDHVIPLCAGGPDRLENLQWQPVLRAKEKDRQERRQCRQRGR